MAGVAALEATLALRALAEDRVAITLVAPNAEFHYRPLVVRQPFTSAPTSGYKLSDIADRAGAHLLVTDRFKWLDPVEQYRVHTEDGMDLHLRRGARCWRSARDRTRAFPTR